MKITAEMLKRFGYEFENGEESMEFSDAIQNCIFTLDLYHYIRSYYRLSSEEFEDYCKACNIENSENFWRSTNIKNSKNLFNSHYVSNSNFVRNSYEIRDSRDIYNSNDVEGSRDVVHSSQVERSGAVVESQEVYDSFDVARSSHIDWSSVILNSSHLKDCGYTYMSEDLIDCHFCGFMHNSRRCLFCVGLEGKEYYIFNKPVSPEVYNQVKEVLMSKLEDEKSTMIRIYSDKHIAEERFRLGRRFDSIINGLTPEFFGWVGTLPNYSDDVYVGLFYRDRAVEKLK